MKIQFPARFSRRLYDKAIQDFNFCLGQFSWHVVFSGLGGALHAGNVFPLLISEYGVNTPYRYQRSQGKIRKMDLRFPPKLWRSRIQPAPSRALVDYCFTVLEGVEVESEGELESWNSHIREAFKNLSADERQTFKLAFLAGFHQRKTAEKADPSPESIRKNAFEGMARLHKAITEST